MNSLLQASLIRHFCSKAAEEYKDHPCVDEWLVASSVNSLVKRISDICDATFDEEIELVDVVYSNIKPTRGILIADGKKVIKFILPRFDFQRGASVFYAAPIKFKK